MDTNALQMLRDSIESMEKVHQLRILEIIKNNNIDYTENTNGIFINMTILSIQLITSIQEYIKYVGLQQQQLDKGEKDKETLKNEFYKDNKAAVPYSTI